MARFSATDVERVIHDIEFENQQYVKQIEKERQEINHFEKEQEKLSSYIRREEELTPQLDESIKSYHKQFKQNRDNIENLKKTLSVLSEHEEALKGRLQSIKTLATGEREERKKLIECYEHIWQDYKNCYEAFPKVDEVEAKKLEFTDQQSLYATSCDRLNNASEDLLKLKQSCDLEFSPYTNIDGFFVKVAEIYVSYMQAEGKLQEIVNLYSATCVDVQKEEQSLLALQKDNEAKERMKKEAQKLAELQKLQAPAPEKRPSSVEQKNEKPAERTQEPVHLNLNYSKNEKQNIRVLPAFKSSENASQIPKLQLPMTSNKSIGIPSLTIPNRAQTLNASNNLLSMNINNKPKPVQQLHTPSLLRQVHEMKMQKKIIRSVPTPTLQSNTSIQANKQVLKGPSSSDDLAMKSDDGTSSYTHLVASEENNYRNENQSHYIKEKEGLCSPLNQLDINRRPDDETESNQQNIREGDQTTHKTPEKTPGRTVNATTPVLTMSPSNTADSPFDIDKHIERAKMFATKSPGNNNLFKSRPMAMNISQATSKDITEQNNGTADFGSFGFLNSTFSPNIFGAGDGPQSNKNGSGGSGEPDSFAGFDFGGCSSTSPGFDFGGGEGSKAADSIFSMFGGSDDNSKANQNQPGDSGFTFIFDSPADSPQSSSTSFALF